MYKKLYIKRKKKIDKNNKREKRYKPPIHTTRRARWYAPLVPGGSLIPYQTLPIPL